MEVVKVNDVEAMVWCRNGNICRESTPCSELECEYKDKASNVPRGISKCGHYQITTISQQWETAYHLSNDLSKMAVLNTGG